MMTTLILALSCLFLNMMGNNNDLDLKGKTYKISDGDVSMFDGREVKNGTLVIAEGSYLLHAKKEKGACLFVGDNTELVIDGTLQLAPNGFKSCDMIRVVGSHVKIHGKGSIVGDRSKHTGHEGEWGMGIRLHGSRNVTVSGLTIADCWGDCIYIGGGSKNTQISNCQLRGSRRQGISITKADGVFINNCKIANISGTNPQYGIDIEPNKKCSVNNTFIENVEVTNCEGGIRAILPNKGIGNAMIGRVEIRNCQVSAKTRYAIHLNRCQRAIVEACTISSTNERPSVYANYIDTLRICDNTLNVKVQLLSSMKNKARRLVGKDTYSTIRTVHTGDKVIENNRIIEK